MKEISVREARKIIGKLDRILEDEGEIKITRHGKPIARISSLNAAMVMPSHRKLRNSMPLQNQESADLVREDRDGP